MEAVAIGATVYGSAQQAKGIKMRGEEESRAAEFEKQQYEIQEQQTKTAAAQSETRRREDLTSSLETIQALRAGRGVGTYSPTGAAIFGSAIEDVERDIAIDRANYSTKADLSRRAALMAERKGKTSLLAAKYGATAAMIEGGTKAYSMFKSSVSTAAGMK